MSDSHPSADPASPPNREEMMSALFAQLVMQQANMAMMLMGKVANPETGKTVKDVDAARFLIDQLEMLEVKTKGNLSKEELALLKQSLMTLRLTYVEAVESPEAKPPPAPTQTEPEKPVGSAAAESGGPSAEEDHRKKFSKKY